MKKFTIEGDHTLVVAPVADKANCFTFTGEELEVKDEYHSMHELYQHRMALNIALFRAWDWMHGEGLAAYHCIRSKFHNDGTMFEGYFIVMANTPNGQVSYHYKLEHWDKFDFLEELDKAPMWDGHNSLDVIERLNKL